MSTARVWSEYQSAVFAGIAQGEGHMMVDAVAGSGKTTTIVEGLSNVPRGKSVLFVAFNKPIATELAKRAPSHVNVSTLHALGLRACSASLPNRPRVDADKAKTLAASLLPGDDLREWRTAVCKAVSLSKSYLAESAEDVADVIDVHDIAIPRDGLRGQFVADVRKMLAACAEHIASVDFDDMVWMPVILELGVPQYDRVFVDETQDLNAAQIKLALRACKPGGRICAVGDPRQAIYQFRGAGEDSFGKVRDGLDAKVLPLSVTYRCSKAVVREAQKLVPHLQAAPGAIEGSVSQCSERDMFAGAGAGDFILSRVNAPLMKLCLAFLRNGQAACIQGRDIGTKIVATIRRAGTADVGAMLKWVDSWADRETLRLEKRGLDAESVQDLRDCIRALSEEETFTYDVISKIERLFADGDNASRITLSSTHKAKGLERKNVWLLRNTYMRSRKAPNGKWMGPGIAEANLLYVAITRAQVNLYMVNTEVQS